MRIEIHEHDLKRIESISYYNHNYYEIPFTVNGCNILFQDYNGADEFMGYSVGNMTEEGFVPKFWLHTNDRSEKVIFDSDTIKDHNEWT